MDCFIVRIYRHFSSNEGADDEIAGLVELVGDKGGGKPFSSYKGLVSAMRNVHQVNTTSEFETSKDTGAELVYLDSARGRHLR